MTMPLATGRSGGQEPILAHEIETLARGTSDEETLSESLSYELLQLRIDLGKLRAELDAAERRAAEEAHRNRNLLMVVDALIRRALAGASDGPTLRAALEALPGRLAESQAAAARDDGDLGGLVAATVAGFDLGVTPPAITIAGPSVELAPAARRLMALVLFELATNAVKHGALGVSNGRVTINWECRPGTGLTLVWLEAGGVPFANGAGPSGGGGASLLAAVERELGGTVRRVLAPGGARVEIDLPARHVLRCLPLRAGRRALVIDDNVIIAADLAEMLASTGLGEVVVASNAEDARRHLAGAAFDVVFLDVMLGTERSDALLGQMADARVVIVTGVAPEELPAPFRALPLLAKPYGPRDVSAVLDGDTAEPA